MFSNIIWAWASIKPVIDANEKTIHILVPVGTLVSLYMGWKNSSHLRKQANLQREIEGNRYRLELFDKRFRVYTEYSRNMVKYDCLNVSITKNNSDDILLKLENNLSYIDKCLIIFSSKSNELKTLKSRTEIIIGIVKSLIEYEENVERLTFVYKTINEEYHANGHNPKSEIAGKDLLYSRNNLAVSKRNYKIKIDLYDQEHTACLIYMESKLSVPEQAFEKQPWFFVKWWQTANTFRVKHPVMFWLGAVCVLFLSVLLCL